MTISTIRDRSGNLWTVSRVEGQALPYVATCDYGMGIKGSFIGASRAAVEADCANANFRG